MGAQFIPFGRFEPAKVKPLLHRPDMPDGRLNLTTSAFNQLVLVAGLTATQNSPFSSLAVAVIIASTHCAYTRRAEFAWVVGCKLRWFIC